MILSSKDVPTKQELEINASSSRYRFRSPRVVRVSPASGGKDRHSKVRTVRGLRDRRIRLSVPTAVLLYDLQDKLGLNQPSKVIDWLIQATKNDIDKLPPLQLPCGGFSQLYEANILAPSDQHSAKKMRLDGEVGVGHKGKWAGKIGNEGEHFAGFNSFYPSNVTLAQPGSHEFLAEPSLSNSLTQAQLIFNPQPAVVSSLFYNFPSFITMDSDPAHFSLNASNNEEGS